ncbi:MAG: hypothetical protein ACOCVF_02060 [bacterium]
MKVKRNEPKGKSSIQELNPLNDRLGKIAINRKLLIIDPKPEFLTLIFSNFYPFHIETRYDIDEYGTIIYTGYSKFFGRKNEGEPIPSYQFTFKDTDSNKPEIDDVIVVNNKNE